MRIAPGFSHFTQLGAASKWLIFRGVMGAGLGLAVARKGRKRANFPVQAATPRRAKATCLSPKLHEGG